MIGNLSIPLIAIESWLRRRGLRIMFYTHPTYHRWALERTPRFMQTLDALRREFNNRSRGPNGYTPDRVWVSPKFFRDFETWLPTIWRFTDAAALSTHGLYSLKYKCADMLAAEAWRRFPYRRFSYSRRPLK